MGSTPQKSVGRMAWQLVIASAGVAVLTAVIYYFHIDVEVANVSMLYLLVVTLSALYLGRGPAVWASILSFLSFDWFFVNPRHTFTVQEPSEWVALFMFLLTAIVIGQLTALLQTRALEARQHEKETAALAEASWAVASQLDSKSALLEVVRQVARVVNLQLAAIIASNPESLAVEVVALHPNDAAFLEELLEKAQEITGGFPHHEQSEGKTSGAQDDAMFMPIVMNEKLLGLVYLKLGSDKQLTAQQKQIIDSLVNHSAVILQRERLMKSEAKAAALADADRLKTALLSMVSHDFKSPLTSIKASVSSLLGEGTPLAAETQRGLYQGIEQEADRLNRMVNNILGLSRLEADAWRPRLEATPLSELIGMALNTFSKDSNSRIVVSLDPQVVDVAVDPTQMVQVVRNLVENALKYSPERSTVEIQSTLDNGSAVIEVLDRGRGLPAEADDIFKPFWRAPDLHESSIPGVGIGLAVCRGLVEAHGGRLSAADRPGGGSLFRVTLPLNSSNGEVTGNARAGNR